MNLRVIKPASLKRCWQLGLMAAIAVVLITDSLAADTNVLGKVLTYEDFRLIQERNIFNPRRTARRAQSTERRESQRAPAVEHISLLGTMSYEKGYFAFFEGSRQDFRKAAQPGDRVGPYRIAAIEQKSIKLVSGTNWVDLAVGKQLRRSEDGPWQVSDTPAQSSYSGSSSTSGQNSGYSTSLSSHAGTAANAESRQQSEVTNADMAPVVIVDPETGLGILSDSGVMPTNAPAAGSEADEILRRMMERREQELNR